MKVGFIKTYVTVGATFGTILAVPLWHTALAGHAWPKSWDEAAPTGFALLMATGHGVLRMYTWLPSMIYFMGVKSVPIELWLFNGW